MADGPHFPKRPDCLRVPGLRKALSTPFPALGPSSLDPHNLETAKVVQDILLLPLWQSQEIGDRLTGLRAVTEMRFDRFQQVGGAAIVQEEYPLSDPPQRCRAELSATGIALRDLISKAAHGVHLEVTEG